MNTLEISLPNRDGVFTRNGVSQDFKIRRKNLLWDRWYWIDTPTGINCANIEELSFDDNPPKP